MEQNKNQFVFAKRNIVDGNSNSMDVIDDFYIDINQPSFIVFGGNTTTSLEESQRMARIATNWVIKSGVVKEPKDYEVVSVMYNDGSPLYNLKAANPDYNFGEITERLFMPLVFDEQGRRLSYFESLTRVSNLTFFAHSAGALVLDRALQKFVHELMDNGYDKRQIKQLLGHVKVIAFAPFSDIDLPVKSIYITPLYDELQSFGKLTDSIKQYYSTNPHYRKLSVDIDEFFDMPKRVIKNGVTHYSINNGLVIIPDRLCNPGFSNHGFAGIVCGPNGEVSPVSTKIGKQTTKFISDILGAFISNGIRNSNNTKRLTEVKVEKLRAIYNKAYNKERLELQKN